MATALASRYSVLSVDDEDDSPSKNSKKKKQPTSSQNNAQKGDAASAKKKSKKKKDQIENNDVNGQRPKSKPPKKGEASAKQWEQWKKWDADFVAESYEQDLSEAIMQSKLDFEQKKEFYHQMQKETEDGKKGKKKEKKKDKPQTMSLDEFNSLPANQFPEPLPAIPKVSSHPPFPPLLYSRNDLDSRDGTPSERGMGDNAAGLNGVQEEDRTFFDRIQEDTKKVLDREQRLELCRSREPYVAEAVSLVQYKEQLEKRDEEIVELRATVERLKSDLHLVKSRNKKLCSILGQGEMRDKAEVLVEVEKLKKVRDELTTEVTTIHALLEQERSKVHSLTTELKKPHGKRRTSENT